MAMTAAGTELFFFGGVGAAGTESILDVSDDLWRFETRSLKWRRVHNSGDWPNARRCAGICAWGRTVQLWGGSGIETTEGVTRYTFLNDWWQFDIDRNGWRCLHASNDKYSSSMGSNIYPVPRYTPVFIPIDGGYFLFGGYTEDRFGKRKLNDAWMSREGDWHEIRGNIDAGYQRAAKWPGLRYGCMSATDGRNVYICGGFSDDGDHNDLWCFNCITQEWTILSPDEVSSDHPAQRYCASFSWHHDGLFLFGGRSRRFPKLNFNDLWMFDIATAKWQCISENRAPHCYNEAALFPGYHAKSSSASAGDYWYIFGGEGIHGHVSDFWRFCFESRTWELIQKARDDDPIFW